MSEPPLYEGAWPYFDDVLALPVKSVDVAAQWYRKTFGLSEVRREEQPFNAVIMERDGVQIGFSENGGDSPNDGAAILVSDIDRAHDELIANGLKIGDIDVDERDGKKYRVFFVVAPDELCYYFHQLVG